MKENENNNEKPEKQLSKQTIANKKWQEKNKAKSNYLKKRSTAKSFVRNEATKEDIEAIRLLLEERLALLDTLEEPAESEPEKTAE